MSFQSKLYKLKDVAFNFKNVFCQTEYLFIHSHMRSRSSVLAHILGSNQEIIGYSEQGRSYRNLKSLIDLRINLSNEFKCNFNDKILLDKILHNQFLVHEDVLEKYKPKILFLIRDPEDTFRSIINLGRTIGVNLYLNQDWILKYYSARLNYLKTFSSKVENSFFIESDELINNSQDVLSELSKWLGLKENLEPIYEIFPKTGKKFFGDPLENISAGELISTKKHLDISLSESILKKAEEDYLLCRDELILKSQNIVP